VPGRSHLAAARLQLQPSCHPPQGFSSNLFGYYPTRPATSTVSSNQFGKSHKAMITPKVLVEARAQLGCASLAAVPLEDEGGYFTEGSHWEHRLFQVRLQATRLPPPTGSQPAAQPAAARPGGVTAALLPAASRLLGQWLHCCRAHAHHCGARTSRRRACRPCAGSRG
jgi:hypothetical protein